MPNSRKGIPGSKRSIATGPDYFEGSHLKENMLYTEKGKKIAELHKRDQNKVDKLIEKLSKKQIRTLKRAIKQDIDNLPEMGREFTTGYFGKEDFLNSPFEPILEVCKHNIKRSNDYLDKVVQAEIIGRKDCWSTEKIDDPHGTSYQQIPCPENMVLKTLDWAYGQAIEPNAPMLESAQQLADGYLKGEGTLYEKANSLIRWQNAKCATSGFITGLGGILTLPVAVPANLSSVLFVQMRMVAAIAIMGGYDVHDHKVKTLAYVCLLGDAGKYVLSGSGITLGGKVGRKLLKTIPITIVKKLNKTVGARLITRLARSGVINFGKGVPLIGGLIGGTFDALSANAIGNMARDTFIPNQK